MFVKDRMSKHPLTVSGDTSISETHKYMLEQKVRHLPVVDKTGKMIGLVTDGDLLKAVKPMAGKPQYIHASSKLKKS